MVVGFLRRLLLSPGSADRGTPSVTHEREVDDTSRRFAPLVLWRYGGLIFQPTSFFLIMNQTEPSYFMRSVHQQDGSVRHVYEPSKELRDEQKEVLQRIRQTDLETFMPHAHGGVRGRS